MLNHSRPSNVSKSCPEESCFPSTATQCQFQTALMLSNKQFLKLCGMWVDSKKRHLG